MTNSTPHQPTRRLRDLAEGERPQERLERFGPAALSDIELLAMLLRSGSKGHNVLELASSIINEVGSLSRLISWKEIDFRKMKGIGKVKSLQMVAVLELARRVLDQQQREQPLSLNDPGRVYSHFIPVSAGLEVEKFWVLCLNRKNMLIKRVEITSGTASSSLVHPREVFREAIRVGACAIIAVHNHPSGDPGPSSADIQVTRQLREAAKTVAIDFLDHVIVGDKRLDPRGLGFYSFKDNGLV